MTPQATINPTALEENIGKIYCRKSDKRIKQLDYHLKKTFYTPEHSLRQKYIH